MLIAQNIIDYAQKFSYLGIFALIVLSGYIVPIPEEVLLLTAGYLAAYTAINIYLVTVVAVLGVLIGDNFLFWLSHYKGSKIVSRLKKRIRKNELLKYERLMKAHIGKTIFMLRFIVGLRFFGPFLAGSMKTKWKTFQFYNLLAVLIYAPTVVFLGYHFHNKFLVILTELEIVRHILFALVLIALSYLITLFLRKKFLVKSGVKR